MRREISPARLTSMAGLAVLTAVGPDYLRSADLGPDYLRAEPSLVLFLGAIAIAIIAGMMLKRKTPAQERDRRPGVTVERGTQLTYVHGRRMVPGLPVWVGNRNTREESAGGGGKGGKNKGGKQIVYDEDACHTVCLGPASVLHRIVKNQTEIIFTGPISPEDTPSGSTLQTTEGDSFQIWWGEINQGLDAFLADELRLDINSQWPWICKVNWIQRKLGTSATWPQLDYDIECTCIGTELPGSDCSFPESAPGLEDSGMNGAHVLYQLMTGSAPHGGGMNPAGIDFGSLKSLGQLIQAERLPMNILIAEETDLAAIVDDILADASVLMPQNGPALVFMPLRNVLAPPTLDERTVEIPRVEMEVSHGLNNDDQVLFRYPDVKEMFTPTDIPLSDDATSRQTRRRNSRTVEIATITSAAIASVVAERRRLLFLNEGSEIQFSAFRTARRLCPGHVMILDDMGQVRITGVERISTSAKARITATVNQYSLPGTGWVPGIPPGEGGPPAPTADDLVIPFEVPHELGGPNLRIAVARLRLDGVALPAMVWVSTDDVSYANMGAQDASAGAGSLLEELPDSGAMMPTQGPLLAMTAKAAQKAQDLSGNVNGWLAGVQVGFCESEVFFIQALTIEGDDYRVSGLDRSRLFTPYQRHPVGALLGIMQFNTLESFASVEWAAGQILYIKVQPAGVALDTIIPVQLELKGKALGPGPVDNVQPRSYPVNADINFTWTTRINKGTGTGAGELPAGEDYGDEVALDGTFTVEIVDLLGNVVRTEEEIAAPAFTYTDSDRDDDGINERDFVIRITHIKDSYGGYPSSFLIEGTD